MVAGCDKTARECRALAEAISENVSLNSTQTERVRQLLLKAATRIDVLCAARGRLLNDKLPKPAPQKGHRGHA